MQNLKCSQPKKNSMQHTDVWNSMVKLINEHPDECVKERAKMLLSQYNTAGGRMIKTELYSMLINYSI